MNLNTFKSAVLLVLLNIILAMVPKFALAAPNNLTVSTLGEKIVAAVADRNHHAAERLIQNVPLTTRPLPLSSDRRTFAELYKLLMNQDTEQEIESTLRIVESTLQLGADPNIQFQWDQNEITDGQSDPRMTATEVILELWIKLRVARPSARIETTEV